MLKKNSFYSHKELKTLGLKSFGKNVLISRKASFYSPNEICIGNNVRIDDFCILSGEITLFNHIHISAHNLLYGKNGIVLHDFSCLSPRVIVFSAIDDFSGDYLIGPLLPERFTNITGGKVVIKEHALVGAGSIIFPNITIGEGAAVGAMSLVKENVNAWEIVAGIPAKFLKKRKKGLLEKAKQFEDESE